MGTGTIPPNLSAGNTAQRTGTPKPKPSGNSAQKTGTVKPKPNPSDKVQHVHEILIHKEGQYNSEIDSYEKTVYDLVGETGTDRFGCVGGKTVSQSNSTAYGWSDRMYVVTNGKNGRGIKTTYDFAVHTTGEDSGNFSGTTGYHMFYGAQEGTPNHACKWSSIQQAVKEARENKRKK